MTNIKDKLTSSVRQARSTTPSKAVAPRVVAEDTKQTNIQAKPVRQTAEPVSSAQALFPDRVWPD
ncbi:hypothetical protein [Nitrosomonas eutropha]|uniref:Uncharacterized protein n=1 Tax=Nitrosomonas eutropha TaxID=916 RepID=A0ABX5MB80_9PROT|nr:hypothetical protein [Nitrosomonas eutropha]PXV83957.1 hypothetical protein C8R14_10276 [Nitrosomonas eutropha]SEI45743.1 hypothetical protein SAMN05216318_10371 [Nitrosomonas eutropha]